MFGRKKDIEAKKMQNINGLDTFEGKFDSENCENNNNTCCPVSKYYELR